MVLVHLGQLASVQDVLSELECLYGNVSSTEKLREKFYSTSQKEGESVADYSIRLQELIATLPVDRRLKNEMLCSRLWSGLRDPDFRNFSRFKYESISDFSLLRKVLREMEEDFRSSAVSPASHVGSSSVSSNNSARQFATIVDSANGINGN